MDRRNYITRKIHCPNYTLLKWLFHLYKQRAMKMKCGIKKIAFNWNKNNI